MNSKLFFGFHLINFINLEFFSGQPQISRLTRFNFGLELKKNSTFWKDSLHLCVQKERAAIWKYGQQRNLLLPLASTALEFELEILQFVWFSSNAAFAQEFQPISWIINEMLQLIILFWSFILFSKVAASKLVNPLQSGCFLSFSLLF